MSSSMPGASGATWLVEREREVMADAPPRRRVDPRFERFAAPTRPLRGSAARGG